MGTQTEIQDRQNAIVEERLRLREELASLEGKTGPGYEQRRRNLEAAIQKRVDESHDLISRLDALMAEEEQLIQRREAIMNLHNSGDLGTEAGVSRYQTDDVPTVWTRNGNPWSTPDAESSVEVRSRALAAVERWNADDTLKESATRTVERLTDSDEPGSADVRGVSDHIIRYSDPTYVAAFRKYARDPEGYLADLTPDENRTWRAAREHQRATLQTSGAVLPSPLDPTVVLVNDSTVDPMRSVARVDTTMSLTKRYVVSPGSTFSFDAESAEVSDDTPTLTEVEITTRRGAGFIEASIEVAMDQPDFTSEVAKMIADAKDRLEGDKFVNGAAGSNEPIGIVTALTGEASEVDAAGEDIAADDVYGLLEALPPRFRQNAAWQLELSTLNKLARLYNPQGSEPPLIEGDRLLRRIYVENSNLDPYSDIDAAATATHRPLIIGDWRQFVVLDRVGTSVTYMPPGVLQGASGRPNGNVGWFAHWRTGSAPLTIAAFRMLKVTTTA